MMAVTSSTCALWILILTTSLCLKGCIGASSNTNKTEYTVGSVLVEPFLMEREEGHMGTEAEYEGFIPDLLNEISRILGSGIHFKITLQPDGKLGSKNTDGTWNGLMGSLTRRKFDLAAAPLTITSMRHRVMDFSKPFMSTGLVMVISDSLTDDSSFSTSRVGLIFKPFTGIAWLMLVVGVLVLLVFAVIIHRLSSQGEKKTDLASICSQLPTCPSGGHYSGCVLRITIVLFVLLTVVMYTAGWVSVLLYKTRMENVQILRKLRQDKYERTNIKDIVKSGQYKIAVIRGGATEDFFRTSKVPLYERIYHGLHYVGNISAGFELVNKNKGYAFITDKAIVDYYISRTPNCGLNIVGGSLTATGYGLGLPLGSKLKERINLAILEMQEDGVLQMLHQKWWYQRAQCGRKPAAPGKMKVNDPTGPSIDGTTLGGVLIILAIGILLVVGVAVVERFLCSRSSKIGRPPLDDSTELP